jgi:hypothetical protein
MMPVVTLCFREAGSTDPSTSYCPLGIHEESLVGNPVDGPLVELALRDGADALPAAYPVVMTNQGIIFLGVGLLLTVRNGVTSEELGRMEFGQVNGMGNRAPGTFITTGAFRTMPDFGALISASFMADCVPEFTGPNCTTPAPPTTPAQPTIATPTTLTTQAPTTTPTVPTTPAPPTTATLTTQASTTTPTVPTTPAPPTVPTTPAPPTTADIPTEESPTDAPSSSTGSETSDNSRWIILHGCSLHGAACLIIHVGTLPIILGAVIVVGLIIGILIGVLSSVAITCYCLKRGKRRGKPAEFEVNVNHKYTIQPHAGAGEGADAIELSRNPVYGVPITTGGNIEMSRRPVYGKSSTDSGSEYYYIS